MFAFVVGVAVLFWVGVFLAYFASQGKSPLDHFLGSYEPLPDDLGQWRVVPPSGADEPSTSIREERFLLPEGRSGAGHLLHQVRYRDRTTGDIVRTEPESRVARRRIRGRPTT